MDSTNIERSFDFDLEWTGRRLLAAKGTDGISVFDAVEKQLGLKIELKDVRVPSLSIANVNRTPTPNAPSARAWVHPEMAPVKPE